MSEKIAIVYIGNKPVKKDTITGSRLSFPRMVPVDVESALAVQLLDHPTVWVRADMAETVAAEQEQAAKDAEAAAEAAAEEAARRAAEESFVVGDTDLGKMTSAQLTTFCVANDIDITQGPREAVNDYRVRVRDAYRAKVAA